MSQFHYSRAVIQMLRRTFGQDSPMNVFPKTFTRVPSAFEELRYEALMDMKFLNGSAWPAGHTVNIRKPQGLQDGPR